MLAQHLDVDALSAYLDQHLPPAEQAAAARHLATCPDCAHELAELRATVALLRTLPHYAPGQSFQLGPEHARRRGGDRRAEQILWGWLDRLVPALPAVRVATVAAAVLLVAVITGGVVAERQAAAPTPPAVVMREAPAAGGVVEGAAGDAAESEILNEPPGAAMPAAPALAPPGGADPGQLALEETSGGEAADSAAGIPPAGQLARGTGTEAAAPASMKQAADAGAASRQMAASTSGWRVAAVALGLILVWLIMLVAALSARRRGFW